MHPQSVREFNRTPFARGQTRVHSCDHAPPLPLQLTYYADVNRHTTLISQRLIAGSSLSPSSSSWQHKQGARTLAMYGRREWMSGPGINERKLHFAACVVCWTDAAATHLCPVKLRRLISLISRCAKWSFPRGMKSNDHRILDGVATSTTRFVYIRTRATITFCAIVRVVWLAN